MFVAALLVLGVTPLAFGFQEGEDRVPGPDRQRYLRIKTLEQQLQKQGQSRRPNASAHEKATAELHRLYTEVRERVEEGEVFARSVYYAARALADHGASPPGTRLEYLEAQHAAARPLGLWKKRGSLALEIEGYYRARGDYELAEDLLQDALSRLAPDDPRNLYLRLAISQIQNHLGDWNAALATIEQAAAGLPATHPQYDLELARLNGVRSQIFLRMGLLDQATVHGDREWRAVRALEGAVEHLRVRGLIHRANLLNAVERHEAIVLEVGTEIRGDALDRFPAERIQLLNRLGVAYASLERHDPSREPKSEEVFRSVLDHDPSPGDLERWAARIRLAQHLLGQGRLEEADVELAALREQGSQSPLEQAHLAALTARLALQTGAEDLAREARSSIREDLDTTYGALEDAFEQLLDNWQEVGLRNGGVGFLRYNTVRFVLAVLFEATMQAEPGEAGRARALEDLIAAQAVSMLARRLDSPEPSIESLRELLGEKEGMLFYLPSIDSTHVFALDRSGLVHAATASRPETEAEREPFVDEVTRSPFGLDDPAWSARMDRLRDRGGRLFDILFPTDVRACLERWDAVTIVAPELLGYLPFECLPTSGGSWLGLDKAIGYAPSAAVALALERRRAARAEEAPPARDLLLVAAPAIAGDLPPEILELPALPFGEAQREVLTKAYAEERLELLEGPAASFEALDAGRLDARVAHFLVHGIHDYERERTAGLLLASDEGRDGRVFADRLDDLPTRGLALLTACGTGRGPARWGDSGSSHLGGIFLAAGSDTVILPYAELAYDPTVELAATFHARIRRGDGPAEALRRARRALGAEGRLDDPYYHGLLHVRGLPHAALFPRVRGSVLGWELAAGLAAVAGIAIVVAIAIRSRNRPPALHHHRS